MNQIIITQKDIDEATELCKTMHKASNCPIAVNLKKFLGVEWLVVNLDVVYTNFDRIELPAIAVDFQKRFDEGKTVIPFSFKINFKEECQRDGYFRPFHAL